MTAIRISLDAGVDWFGGGGGCRAEDESMQAIWNRSNDTKGGQPYGFVA